MSVRSSLRRAALTGAAAALTLGALGLCAGQAAASIAPTLTLTPSSVPAGAPANETISFDEKFNPTAGDSVKDVTTILPPGLLANANLEGGLCLLSPTPVSACQVGTATVTGTLSGPASLYLVRAPAAADVAGVAVCAGTTPCTTPLATGAVSVRPASDPNGSGLNLAFTNLPALAGISELNATFTGLRTPTSCPTTPAEVIYTADSQSDSTLKTAMAPLTVTGCSSLGYHPAIAAQVIKDPTDSGAEVITATSQPAALSESATKTLSLGVPSSLAPNTGALIPCFASPSPSSCKIGTATGASPLVPSAALADGTVTLGGTVTSPTLTISFPAVNLTLTGTFNSTFTAITFNNLPDTPLTNLVVDITGTSAGRAFLTTCTAANSTAAFTPWDGNAPVVASAPITYQGCASRGPTAQPTISGGFIGGLPGGHPTLRFTVTHGTNAPDIASIAIGPARGLRFMKCRLHGHRCAGLSVAGAKVKRVTLSGGRLVITLTKPSPRVTVTVAGPLLIETAALRNRVKRHKVKQVTFTIKVSDASHRTTTLLLKLKA